MKTSPWIYAVMLFWLVGIALVLLLLMGVGEKSETASYFHKEQARAGQVVYAQHCASCHGSDLLGISAPALVGHEFWESWEGKNVQQLYSYIVQKMPQGQGGSLPQAYYSASTAYLLQQNGFPEGKQAIEPSKAHLGYLTLEPERATHLLTTSDLDSSEVQASEMAEPRFYGYVVQSDPELQGQAFLGEGAFEEPLFLQSTSQETDSETRTSGETSTSGENIFAQNCATCHGNEGGGGAGPALANNHNLADITWVLSHIIEGRGAMPSFAQQLSDEQIAAVSSFIRRQWQNDFPEIDLQTVQDYSSTDANESSPGSNETSLNETAPNGEETRAEDEASGTLSDTDSGTAAETAENSTSEKPASDSAEQAFESLSQERANVSIQSKQEDISFRLEGPDGYSISWQGSSLTLGNLLAGRYQLSAEKEGFASRTETLELEAGETLSFELNTLSPDSGSPDSDQTESEAVDQHETASPATEASAGADSRLSSELNQRQVELGTHLYGQHCTACHGIEGVGGIGPKLTNNERIRDARWVVERILLGIGPMPAFAAQLNAFEVSSLNQLLATWNTQLGPITETEVSEIAQGFRQEALNPALSDLTTASLGQQRYTEICSACHGLQGGGDVGPPLAGNPNLDNTQLVLNTLLYGRGLMPAFSLYSNQDIAEIASYIRSSWTNAYGQLSAAEVREYRSATEYRSETTQ